MAKRKRQQVSVAETTVAFEETQTKKSKPAPAPTEQTTKTNGRSSAALQAETLQIIAGSYDQVLHGMTASFHSSPECQFSDTFLFNAHSSAIRCVAVSPVSAPIPGQAQKVLLATGSTDERIHVYSLSAHPPPRDDERSRAQLAAVASRPIRENPKNREVGTLLHHASTVTALRFPTRGKLLSSSDDSTMAVTRTRDWSVLSTVKAPIPKAHGRPSGDTAPFGGAPSGVNDFAIHPSMKVMISVSRGERCMRLWNLVTGKKAGVLSFTRDMLVQAGEGKHASGEGRRVVWGSADGADEFAVTFDRDVIVFGMDSVPKCRVMPFKSKLHQIAYLSIGGAGQAEEEESVMAVSTEDGRVLFFSTKTDDLERLEEEDGEGDKMPLARLVGQLGGRDAGVTSRVKDFVVLRSGLNAGVLYVVTASSDGKVRVWTVMDEELRSGGGKSVGALAGVYETNNRITCLAAFVMVPRPDGAEDSEEEDVDEDKEEASDDSEDESD
ncbi:WD40 repeat-like-containing domain protein [Cordyceps fumosorosea ARSEF 2679]|uniref:WD40 repeat-like-containing domain protein n=1 Tax=Cordyceps fumosorosea (strain ARSEF 2679) TaxID=1081104 RepID=A0A168CG71_CORFA|nr:WD40 repeat-like-containing domain protein [Cordyceps fumosorosea ARSEF 2679]OAA71335.1 WD40 repeat-like-containing domain protein [Cordyceps fumosorosea ARSEF 2679]